MLTWPCCLFVCLFSESPWLQCNTSEFMIFSFEMFFQKLLLFFICCQLNFEIIFCKIVCDVQSYVLTGMEFAKCNQGTMESFSTSPINFNPCPALKHLVYSCSEVLKPCYDERGYHRGQQTFLELLSLQYPDQNECDLFNKNAKSEVPQQLPGEKCSINDEVALLHEMKACSSEAQATVLTSLLSHPLASDQTTMTISEMKPYFDLICEGLDDVSNKCFVKKLPDCYEEEDAPYHLAFLLEELRLTGITLVSHLTVGKVNGSEQQLDEIVDVENCPVFKNGPLAVFLSHQETMMKGSTSSYSVTVLAVLLTLIVTMLISALGYFAIVKFRIIPRIRARLDNSPYTDFIIQDQANQVESELGPNVVNIPKPSHPTISMVVASESTAIRGGPST